MPTKPADRQSNVAPAPSDFESQLQTLAFEATHLALVPTTFANLAPGDTAWLHGPWDPGQCSLVLLRWLDADLVVLLESTTTPDRTQVVTESRQLTYDQARTLLADPLSWQRARPSGATVHLTYNGERALTADDEVWWSTARAGHRTPVDGGNPSSPRVTSHAAATRELAATAAGTLRHLSDGPPPAPAVPADLAPPTRSTTPTPPAPTAPTAPTAPCSEHEGTARSSTSTTSTPSSRAPQQRSEPSSSGSEH